MSTLAPLATGRPAGLSARVDDSSTGGPYLGLLQDAVDHDDVWNRHIERLLTVAQSRSNATMLLCALINRSACLVPSLLAEGLLPAYMQRLAVAYARPGNETAVAAMMNALALALTAAADAGTHSGIQMAEGLVQSDPVDAVRAAYVVARELAAFDH